MKKYDYIILGSGPVAMHLLAKLEITTNEVLVVEKSLWGGTCPNTGCQPKIFMEGTVRPVLNSYYLAGKGIKEAAKIDWPTLVARKKKIWAAFHKNERKSMTGKHSDTIQGKGIITGPHTVKVGDQEYEGKDIVIGTGLSPRDLDIPGGKYAITNNEFFDLDELPKRAIVIGGGYVAMELATILQAAGTEVTILQHSDRLLRPFDQDYVQELKQIMEERGIKFHMNAPVKQITKDGDQYTVTTTNGENFDTDLVINAAGRKPNVEGMGLKEVGIDFDPKRGIKVNEHMQTSIPSIFAAGDVADNGQPNLTPVAWVDAYHIINFIENGITDPIKYPAVATNAFTYPEIAQVGIREDDMEEGDYVKTLDLSDMFFSIGEGDSHAKLKVILNKNGVVRGASELSIHAAEDINNFVPLVGRKYPAKFVEENLTFAFPTPANNLDTLFR